MSSYRIPSIVPYQPQPFVIASIGGGGVDIAITPDTASLTLSSYAPVVTTTITIIIPPESTPQLMPSAGGGRRAWYYWNNRTYYSDKRRRREEELIALNDKSYLDEIKKAEKRQLDIKTALALLAYDDES